MAQRVSVRAKKKFEPTHAEPRWLVGQVGGAQHG